MAPLTWPEPINIRLSGWVRIVALQLLSASPLLPLQIQLHGPLPETLEAKPVEHKFVDGTAVNVPPLLLPQAPLTGGGIRLNVAAMA